MERAGYLHCIQGGGSDSGFRTPNTLKFDDPRLYRDLVKKITKRPSEAASKYHGKSNKQHMSNWKSSLLRRMFLIDSIRPMPKYSKPDTLPVTSGTCPRINSPKSSSQSSSTGNQERLSAGNQNDRIEIEFQTATTRLATNVLHQFDRRCQRQLDTLCITEDLDVLRP